jgi:hypothetical protein
MSRRNTNFDGCLYKDETILNENNNVHLENSNHRFIFLIQDFIKLLLI